MDKIDLPDDGKCPCGDPCLTLAVDKTEYTTYVKDPEYGWEAEGSYLQDMENKDPMGNVRMFCPSCGQYFNVPQELG